MSPISILMNDVEQNSYGISLEMVKLLIEHGAKPSIIPSLFAFTVEENGGVNEPSAVASSMEVLELLVANGVDIHGHTANGRNGFIIALEYR
jgi:hypothetical protein